MGDLVLILGYDAAGSRAVAQALRAEQIYCRIVSPAISREEAAAQSPRGLILAGGVSGEIPAPVDPGLLDGSWPVLALGDAAAMLCRSLGGEALEMALCGGIGAVSFTPCPLTEGIDACERMLRSVRQLRLSEFTRVLATSQDTAVGLMHAHLPLYGLQFALEPNDTDGMRLLLNFALNICGCTRWWNDGVCVENAVEDLRRHVGEGRAVCAVTGGLNSSTVAALAHRALGDRLQCIFVDTGLMRENEGAQALEFYRGVLGLDVRHVQAESRFLDALNGIADPDEKRRVISRTLQSVLDETLAQMGDFALILRSTTADDLMRGEDIACRPGLRGGVPTYQPLRELFKEEVRRVAECLGLPQEIIRRPSFPGTGLALRILGEVTPARLQTLRAAEQVFSEEVSAAGLTRRMRHHFAVLAPMPGDDPRAVVVLRAVQSTDAPLAYAARLPYDLLERVTESILRKRPEVTRVVYDLTPSTRKTGVEWQ